MALKARAAGASVPHAPQDHGFMYGLGSEDLDGHFWELVHMDEAAAPPREQSPAHKPSKGRA